MCVCVCVGGGGGVSVWSCFVLPVVFCVLSSLKLIALLKMCSCSYVCDFLCWNVSSSVCHG